MESITVHISGMACGGCASTVEKALLALDGVVSAEVSHAEGCAAVIYDPAKVQFSAIKTVVEALGYIVR